MLVDRILYLVCDSVILRFSNYLPNNKILDLTKILDRPQSNVAQMIISIVDGGENIVGKGENAGKQHFLLFHDVFKRLLSWGR